MSLEDEIRKAAREIVKDGYEMSVGEIISLYKDKDLLINPDFQRYFRWTDWQKTKFIESILLGIPIPAIFVYQTDDGKWELVDGLQRLSTLFEFTGILRKPEDGDKFYAPSVLSGTKLLPSLNCKKWEPLNAKDKDALTISQQREIKRARIRVEILKKESDESAKFELFQRLNTGGSELQPQEIRNCTMAMLNKDFAKWIKSLSEYEEFSKTISISSRKETKQDHIEYVLRFLAYRNIPYNKSLDVHEYLDEALITLASNKKFNYKTEEQVFKKTFNYIFNNLGNSAFKKYSKGKFSGQFLISAYEVISIGVSNNIDSLLKADKANKLLKTKIVTLWSDTNFTKYSGAGVRGTTRLDKLIPIAHKFFKP